MSDTPLEIFAGLNGLHKQAVKPVIITPGLEPIFAKIKNIAAFNNSPVFISGETGVGKTAVARVIHQHSGRANKPFHDLYMGILDVQLANSALFGHVRGAFTGADRSAQGAFDAADGGTLFLDEIADLHPDIQAKLLQFLDSGTYTPLGSTEKKNADIRIIAATSKNLETQVQTGRFREDLYYRLCVLRLHVPPLRERLQDIPVLAQHFAEQIAKKNAMTTFGFSEDALTKMQAGQWTGNARDLDNEVARAILAVRMDGAKEILPQHVQVDTGLQFPVIQFPDDVEPNPVALNMVPAPVIAAPPGISVETVSPTPAPTPAPMPAAPVPTPAPPVQVTHLPSSAPVTPPPPVPTPISAPDDAARMELVNKIAGCMNLDTLKQIKEHAQTIAIINTLKENDFIPHRAADSLFVSSYVVSRFLSRHHNRPSLKQENLRERYENWQPTLSNHQDEIMALADYGRSNFSDIDIICENAERIMVLTACKDAIDVQVAARKLGLGSFPSQMKSAMNKHKVEISNGGEAENDEHGLSHVAERLKRAAFGSARVMEVLADEAAKKLVGETLKELVNSYELPPLVLLDKAAEDLGLTRYELKHFLHEKFCFVDISSLVDTFKNWTPPVSRHDAIIQDIVTAAGRQFRKIGLILSEATGTDVQLKEPDPELSQPTP